MANEQNLIPGQHKLTLEEQSRGGKASGAARRRRKSLKEAADLYLSLSITDTKQYNKLAKAGVDPEDIDNQMAVIAGLQKAAAKGDAKAARALFDLLGEDSREDSDEGVQIIDDL